MAEARALCPAPPEFTHTDAQCIVRRGSKLNMQDKVVMGDQNYGLRGLTRFSDNEGDIIWPAWRAELKQLVKFEIGTIGNKIIEGEFKEEDVDQGEVAGDISLLVNALIPKTRAEVQTRSDWMERVEVEDDSSSSSSGLEDGELESTQIHQ